MGMGFGGVFRTGSSEAAIESPPLVESKEGLLAGGRATVTFELLFCHRLPGKMLPLGYTLKI